MTNSSPPIRKRSALPAQRGATTILISLTLVLACVLLTISVAQTVTLETRMARNALLASQARLAAQAGLNYASSWLKHTRPSWLPAADGSDIAAPDSNPPNLASASGGDFAINIGYERRDEWAGYLRVSASAIPAQAPEIEALASQFIRPSSALTWAGESAPPLLVDGCADLSGSSDLYPANADSDNAGVVLQSSATLACTDIGASNLHGGSLQAEAFAAGSLWQQVFSISRDEFAALAADQQSLAIEQREYWWATASDLTGGEWRSSVGSPDRPILLVIPDALGCPRFSGGALIVGVVLIEADCSGAAAWGDVQLYGSLAVTGNFAALGPGSRLAHISEHPDDGPARIEAPLLDVIVLAGSWKDF